VALPPGRTPIGRHRRAGVRHPARRATIGGVAFARGTRSDCGHACSRGRGCAPASLAGCVSRRQSLGSRQRLLLCGGVLVRRQFLDADAHSGADDRRAGPAARRTAERRSMGRRSSRNGPVGKALRSDRRAALARRRRASRSGAWLVSPRERRAPSRRLYRRADARDDGIAVYARHVLVDPDLISIGHRGSGRDCVDQLDWQSRRPCRSGFDRPRPHALWRSKRRGILHADRAGARRRGHRPRIGEARRGPARARTRDLSV
jgi:hypothetical protein